MLRLELLNWNASKYRSCVDGTGSMWTVVGRIIVGQSVLSLWLNMCWTMIIIIIIIILLSN